MQCEIAAVFGWLVDVSILEERIKKKNNIQLLLYLPFIPFLSISTLSLRTLNINILAESAFENTKRINKENEQPTDDLMLIRI